MLTEERIAEAKRNFATYLSDGLIAKASMPDKRISEILSKNSAESLSCAEMISTDRLSPLWTIVCSYYSMYYVARLILLSKGYKVGDNISHKVTSDALIVLMRDSLKETLIEDYQENLKEAAELAGLTADGIIESFDQERLKRSRFQYSLSESAIHSKAQTSLERAQTFIHAMKKMLLPVPR